MQQQEGNQCKSDHRILGVTLKTALFLSHRIREAMQENMPALFGQGGGIVESVKPLSGKPVRKPTVPVVMRIRTKSCHWWTGTAGEP